MLLTFSKQNYYYDTVHLYSKTKGWVKFQWLLIPSQTKDIILDAKNTKLEKLSGTKVKISDRQN
jgi:hypothetical protein